MTDDYVRLWRISRTGHCVPGVVAGDGVDHPASLWLGSGADGVTRTARNADVLTALALCEACPVLGECRAYARRYEHYGVVVAGVAMLGGRPAPLPEPERVKAVA